MMSLRQVLGTVTTSFVVLLASCTAPPAPGHPERVDEICSAACSRRSTCSSKVDESACYADCRERGAKTRKYWRGDYVDAATSCLRALPCSAARSSKERTQVCFANSLPTPSATAMRFAELAVHQDAVCHVVYNDPPTVLQRARQFGIYDDSILEQMISCQREEACGQRRRDRRWQCAMNVIGVENKN